MNYYNCVKVVGYLETKIINLGIRFLLEVCALLSLGYFGFQTGKEFLMKLVLGIGIPVLFAVLWGIFGSPAAPMQLSKPLRVVLEITIFFLAGTALYTSGHQYMAIGFVILVVINKTLMFIWKQ